MIMFGSFLPSLLVGFSTTNFTRAWEPTLSWNQLQCAGLNRHEAEEEEALREGTKASKEWAIVGLATLRFRQPHMPQVVYC
jgi:uncharacterized protein YfaT (DUF1175 family)